MTTTAPNRSDVARETDVLVPHVDTASSEWSEFSSAYTSHFGHFRQHVNVNALAAFPLQVAISRAAYWIFALIVIPLACQSIYVAYFALEIHGAIINVAAPDPDAWMKAVSPVCVIAGMICGTLAHLILFAGDYYSGVALEDATESKAASSIVGIWAAPSNLFKGYKGCLRFFLPLSVSIIVTIFFVAVAWCPTWAYFHHMATTYKVCGARDGSIAKKHEDNVLNVLREEYICYRDHFDHCSLAKVGLLSNTTQAVLRGDFTPWIKFLQKGRYRFVAYEFIISAMEQIAMVEIWGGVAACVLFVGFFIFWWTAVQRGRLVDELLESLEASEFQNINVSSMLVTSALGLPEGSQRNLRAGSMSEERPSVGEENAPGLTSRRVALFLDRIKDIKSWRMAHDSSEFRLQSLIKAGLFAFLHWFIPLLFRFLPLEGKMPMLPSDLERMMAQVCGNLALAAALALLAYNLEQSTHSYRKNIHQLMLFRAMWHLPTLDHIVEGLVHKSERKSTRKPLFKWMNLQTQDPLQFDIQMDDSEKMKFIKNFMFVDLMATSDNLQAWWAIREDLLLRQTKERLNMEFLLILLNMYLIFCLVWVLVKLLQHDYLVVAGMNFVLLWDTVCIGRLVGNGVQVCVATNKIFSDELVHLVEVRQRTFKLFKQGQGKMFRRAASATQIEDPGNLRNECTIDALVEHLKLSDDRSTLFGIVIDTGLQLRLFGLAMGLGSSVTLKILLTMFKHIST